MLSRNKPLTAYRRMNRTGRRTNDWRRAWRWLKPRLEARGRTQCEFDFIPHECGGGLDPAHSKKRRLMSGTDIYAVAISCRNFHRVLDEKMTHQEMERTVLRAIERHGGLILPERV
jgi:hypothetical protein